MLDPSKIKYIYIDLFCGAGGTTTGITQAVDKNGYFIAKVIACVNHDKNAIKSHHSNHSDVYHFTEDMRTLNLNILINIVKESQKKYPNAKLIIWASLECTNFSNAKGGKAKNPDSRTLANHLLRYIEILNPYGIQIENVREFEKWGPLDINNKPIKKLEGQSYKEWVLDITSNGYFYDKALLNSADFGGYTSRNRLFIYFSKDKEEICFPKITHNKSNYKSVRDVLELDNIGKSIFTRKKSLVENTLKKIYSGLLLFKDEKDYIVQYYGNSKLAHTIDKPLGTITTKDRFCKVHVKYALYNPQWGGHFRSINRPCFTLIARMDKAPPYLMSTIKSNVLDIKITKDDSPTMILIKEFMIENKITDICIRMLNVNELLKVQGFPSDYKLVGTKTEQKKYIGNSVHPIITKKWVEEMNK